MKREERCPLCDRPRPPRAARCFCNYTFEYETPRHAVTVASPQLASLLLVVAVVAAVLAFVAMPRDPGNQNVGFLLIPAGAFSVLGSVSNWGWFFNASRARLIGALLGRGGARFVYAALGGGLAGAGVALLAA